MAFLRRKQTSVPNDTAPNDTGSGGTGSRDAGPAPTSATSGAMVVEQKARIDEFWRWWSDNSNRFADAMDAGPLDETLAAELRTQLSTAIQPTPGWELGPGRVAKRSLCITAEGDPLGRAPVARLVAAAPAPSNEWEYLGARQPNVDAVSFVLSGGPVDIAFADFRFGVTEFQGTLDIVVYHPAFGQLDEQAQYQATFLGLDSLLGETATERWLGQILVTDEPVPNLVPPEELAGIVERFADEHPEPTWVLLRGTLDNGDPLLVRSLRPLRSAIYPRLDLHGEIVHTYSESNEGLPAGDARDRLLALEDQVEALAGDRIQIVTVVTGDNQQVLHIYCDSQSDAEARVQQVVDDSPNATVTWSLDPAWTGVADYR